MFTDKETADAATSLFTSNSLPRFVRSLPPEDLAEVVDHAKNCAECAALLAPMVSPASIMAVSAGNSGSSVVNMQEWLARKSRGELSKR